MIKQFDKAIIFVGREDKIESYQLLIDCDYLSASYDGSFEREEFFEETSQTFVQRLLQERRNLVVGTINGFKINLETGKLERILKLDEGLVAQLSEKIVTKYTTARLAIPAPSPN